jgi:FkbM family methyltransferase
MGTYEIDKQRALRARLEPGMVVCDIGANSGFYSLLMASAVGHRGLVYAFEPQPGNLVFLRKHLEINRATNVIVSGEAIADFVGEARFSAHRGSYAGRLEDEGQLRVPVVTLDHLHANGRLQPADVLKIDVEGAELGVLKGARAFLNRYRPVVFLATHGREVHRSCCQFLKESGYRLQSLEGDRDVSLQSEVIASTR